MQVGSPSEEIDERAMCNPNGMSFLRSHVVKGARKDWYPRTYLSFYLSPAVNTLRNDLHARSGESFQVTHLSM